MSEDGKREGEEVRRRAILFIPSGGEGEGEVTALGGCWIVGKHHQVYMVSIEADG